MHINNWWNNEIIVSSSPWLYAFSIGAWLCAVMVTQSKNPVHSVFYLVLVFFHASAFLFLLGMEFFALMQLLVYVGALAVMFLFVVMLLDIPVAEIVAYQRGTWAIAGIFFWIALPCIFMLIYQPYTSIWWPIDLHTIDDQKPWTDLAYQKTNAAQFGWVFYTVYVDLLILASILLLVAMIGAVILTLVKAKNVPTFDSFSQQNRDFLKITKKIQSYNPHSPKI
uniref:NADH-ubiquinone oxidoreductase chain 6 n=1 Tax=Jenufa perforata TaxID=993091 RepID=A0A6G7ISZ6_9CHLO|nr:NADH dehydrogenase subunit 6 [Jenufa perforata]QII41625.1 NADH dehydrogenase subunit 6 [Jenufa perforata]